MTFSCHVLSGELVGDKVGVRRGAYCVHGRRGRIIVVALLGQVNGNQSRDNCSDNNSGNDTCSDSTNLSCTQQRAEKALRVGAETLAAEIEQRCQVEVDAHGPWSISLAAEAVLASSGTRRALEQRKVSRGEQKQKKKQKK